MTPTPPRPPGPPPSRPAGPPSGPPRASGATSAPGGSSSGINPKALIAIGVAVAIGAGVLIGVLVTGGDEAEAEEVQLVSTTEPGANPFTPPVAPETPPPNTVAPPQPPYGGTGDNTLCDREGLITFLTDPANAAQAREWARVLSIQVSDIPTFVRDLVPTTVASDTRITNHTFENGNAVGFQAVLQSGTAVLVDTFGKPIVRCRCGNPLLPPKEVKSPTYTGRKWEGFDSTTIVIIQVTNVQIFPAGGVGEIPPQEEPEPDPEPAPEPDVDGAPRAEEIMRAAFVECAASLGAEFDPNLLTYSATPGSVPDVYVVTVMDTETGDQGAWSVNVESGDLTPADPVAAEIAPICPNLG